MRGRALLTIGIILSISNGWAPAGTTPSIALLEPPASVQQIPETPEAPAHAVRAVRVPAKNALRPYLLTTHAPREAAPTETFLPAIDQPDIALKHKRIANEVIRLLPSECQMQLQHFYVRYDKPDRRGLAGKSVIIIDGTLSDDEFRAVLMHEALGHLFDLGCLTGTPQAGKSDFVDGSDPIYNDDPSLAFYRISWLDATHRRPNAKAEDFVTGYAITDPFEDLAESVTYYLLNRTAFVKRARMNIALAAKLRWLQTFLPAASSPPPITKNTAWTGVIPWDATKLPYTWKITTTTLARQS